MGVISFLIFGLVAGIVARLILPGKQPGGWIATLILGVIGAFLGGFIGSLIFHADFGTWSLANFILSVVGAIIVLVIYGAITGRGTKRA
ncbi:membrane protein [Frondihabitans sucicola]|uniref:Membrane protein n=1 Tax=Frondihabitans sucicola TaxID=1268041 RepID=A0ABM8GI50_9MICO|nr:GlsB/YeaQ/YmgE family stress response membrane protein [Frondihabitans sucicola]BDZ48044.1 membrane protein [Frondihabitans sucicola]